MTSPLCPRHHGALTAPVRDVGLSELVCPTCVGAVLPPEGTGALLRAVGLSPDVVRGLASDPHLAPPREFGGALACPCCRAEMKPVRLKGVIADVCFACGALWLDGGELSRISGGRFAEPAAPPPPTSQGAPAPSSLSLTPASRLPSPSANDAAQDPPRLARSVPLEDVFEMLWDCTSCGSVGLLGRSHRYCPNCGAPQDPAQRYFPPAGTDIRVTANYAYEGSDRLCAACTTPNGGKAVFCKSCSSPLDGSARVVRERHGAIDGSDRRPRKPASFTSPHKRHLQIGAVVALVVCVLAVVLLWKKDITVTVAGRTWSRTIGIEQLRARQQSSWCDQKPYDAYNVSRSREVRSHRQVPDGETCTTERKSRGDGSYINERVCRTKYRKEPIYDDMCRYTVDRWGEERAVTAQGTIADPPRWPQLPPLRGGLSLGSEREGQHRARYVVALSGPEKVYDCAYSEARWRSYTEGERYPLKVGVITGLPDCDSLNHR